MAVDCKSLGDVRQNIDQLDRKIVALLAERSEYVRQAAKFKQTKAAVVDLERIEAIIVKVRHLAIEEGSDPTLMENIYRAMIEAFIVFESHEWRHLHERPVE